MRWKLGKRQVLNLRLSWKSIRELRFRYSTGKTPNFVRSLVFFVESYWLRGVVSEHDATEIGLRSVVSVHDTTHLDLRYVAGGHDTTHLDLRVKSIILCKSLNVVISSGHHAHYTCKNVRALFSQFSWKSINIEPIKRSAEAMFG